MPTPLTVVYVLVQPKDKPYARMTFLSASAVRRLHPDARLVLVTDPATPSLLEDAAPGLRALFDEHVVEAADIAQPRAYSFHLKTRVRSLVAGDFVYLDSDTIPVRPFADVFARPWDLAMTACGKCVPDWERPRMEAMGWTNVPFGKYYNAGIFFMRDNDRARALNADWERLWWESYARDDDWDQLALNVSIVTVPCTFLELPAAYNAGITQDYREANGAVIYHLLASDPKGWADSIYGHLMAHLERTGAIDWATLDRCVAMNHPWLPPYWPARLWHTGNRWRAVKAFAANKLQRTPAAG